MPAWRIEIWQAWRACVRRPGFLLLASGVLALGMGASVAVGALVDDVLLRPMPYPQPGRLMAIGRPSDYGLQISPREYQHLGGLDGVVSMGIVEGILAPVDVVCLVLAISGLLACLLPALRAARVHPMRALRGE